MEINNLGFINMDDLRTSAMRGVHNPQQNFDELLRRTAVTGRDAVNTEWAGRRIVDSDIDRNSELFQLCLELENFLVKNLLNSMRNTVQRSGLIDQGFAGKMYEDMLFDEYARKLTMNSGFGLAEQAYRQLRSLQH